MLPVVLKLSEFTVRLKIIQIIFCLEQKFVACNHWEVKGRFQFKGCIKMKAAQFLDDPGKVFEIATMSKHNSLL